MDSPDLAPRVQFLENVGPLENCGLCRFWHRDAMQKAGEMTAAPCRRFPGNVLLQAQQIQGAPTVTRDHRVVPGPMQMQQIPVLIPVMKTSVEWCGEFQLETRAHVIRAAKAP